MSFSSASPRRANPGFEQRWLAGLEVVSAANYDQGYWDHANGEPKDPALAQDVDHRNGRRQSKADTREIHWLATRAR